MKQKRANVTMFKLKCVSCGEIEIRPATECVEMPFCTKCYTPMTLEEVSLP
jgi:hypothetical protein